MRKKNITSEMMMGYIAESLLCLMRKKAYADITIGEVAEKAGVNRSTYYRHFGSKEDIVRHFYGVIMDEYRAAAASFAGADFRHYLLTMFRTFHAHKDDLLLLHGAGLSSSLLPVLNDRFHFPHLTECADATEQFRLSYHLGGIYSNMLLWFSHGLSETPEEMARIAMSMHLDEALTLFAIG